MGRKTRRNKYNKIEQQASFHDTGAIIKNNLLSEPEFKNHSEKTKIQLFQIIEVTFQIKKEIILDDNYLKNIFDSIIELKTHFYFLKLTLSKNIIERECESPYLIKYSIENIFLTIFTIVSRLGLFSRL